MYHLKFEMNNYVCFSLYSNIYKIILQTDYISLILSEQEPIIHCQSNVDRYVICNKKAGNVCQALFPLVLYPVWFPLHTCRHVAHDICRTVFLMLWFPVFLLLAITLCTSCKINDCFFFNLMHAYMLLMVFVFWPLCSSLRYTIC